MGGQSAPTPPSPEDSAKANALSNVAGMELDIGTKPIQAYAEALNQLQYNPIFTRIQGANQARSALQSAAAQRDVMAKTNPYGFALQNAQRQATGDRAMRMLGVNPQDAMKYQSGNIYNYPTQSQLPDLNQVQQQGKQISGMIPTVNMNGNSVWMTYPGQNGNPNAPMPSIPGYQYNPATNQYQPAQQAGAGVNPVRGNMSPAQNSATGY